MIVIKSKNGQIKVSKAKMAELANVSKSTFRRDVEVLLQVAKLSGRTLKEEAVEKW